MQTVWATGSQVAPDPMFVLGRPPHTCSNQEQYLKNKNWILKTETEKKNKKEWMGSSLHSLPNFNDNGNGDDNASQQWLVWTRKNNCAVSTARTIGKFFFTFLYFFFLISELNAYFLRLSLGKTIQNQGRFRIDGHPAYTSKNKSDKQNGKWSKSVHLKISCISYSE